MEAVYPLATQQLGLVTRAQLRAHGIGSERVARLARRGMLTSVQPKVFALPGSVDSPHRDLLAKILETGADATASHSTAAWVWGISGYSRTPVHVVVTRHQRHHQHLSWTVHQFTGLPAHHRRTLDAIPVTSPALTMLHLAQIVSAKRLAIAVDRAWSMRLLSGRDLELLDAELAIQGRNGLVKLREVAGSRGAGWVPPESGLETRFMQLVRGLDPRGFRRQVNVGDGTWTARVDFLHEPSKTVVEIQSERYHTALTDRAADARRKERLERSGFTVVEVWDSELFTNPGIVVDRVLEAIRKVA
jgi:very-short-patch-repair endonuclease